MVVYPSSDSPYVYSITSSVWNLSKNHEIGCAWLVRRRGEDVGGSANADDVILPFLDVCLIMLVS